MPKTNDSQPIEITINISDTVPLSLYQERELHIRMLQRSNASLKDRVLELEQGIGIEDVNP